MLGNDWRRRTMSPMQETGSQRFATLKLQSRARCITNRQSCCSPGQVTRSRNFCICQEYVSTIQQDMNNMCYLARQEVVLHTKKSVTNACIDILVLKWKISDSFVEQLHNTHALCSKRLREGHVRAVCRVTSLNFPLCKQLQ